MPGDRVQMTVETLAICAERHATIAAVLRLNLFQKERMRCQLLHPKDPTMIGPSLHQAEELLQIVAVAVVVAVLAAVDTAAVSAVVFAAEVQMVAADVLRLSLLRYVGEKSESLR